MSETAELALGRVRQVHGEDGLNELVRLFPGVINAARAVDRTPR